MIKPYPKEMRLTFEQLVEETVKNHSYQGGPRSDGNGHQITGDIFYSLIYRLIKGSKLDNRYSDFCRALEARGFWVHS